MTLGQFEKNLRTIIGEATHLRPFVCEGSPLDCRMFIVGFNPATKVSRPLWDFWESGYGFRKAEWLEVYKQERKAQPLKPGKTRRTEVSTTRKYIEWVVEAAAPVKVLETNIYALPSDEVRDLGLEDRVTAPFDFLLETIQPTALLVHGLDAVAHLEQRLRTTLTLGQITYVPNGPAVFAGGHLSRGWTRAATEETGRCLARVCAD